jgi:multiple antibiotic resistance protein
MLLRRVYNAVYIFLFKRLLSMDIFSAAVMLFLIMDPLGNLPIFASILRHIDPKKRRKVLIRELLFALIIMFVCW